jgi:GNAT superfamily N-acetyltransferase
MNPNFTIRSALEADGPAIAQLTNELGYSASGREIEDRLTVLLSSPDQLLIVADADEQICGWLQAHANLALESGFRVEIVGLIVAENMRRQGIGKLLVQHAEQWAAKLKSKTVVVRSNVTRVESHSFYPALGYPESKTQKVYRKCLA